MPACQIKPTQMSLYMRLPGAGTLNVRPLGNLTGLQLTAALGANFELSHFRQVCRPAGWPDPTQGHVTAGESIDPMTSRYPVTATLFIIDPNAAFLMLDKTSSSDVLSA